MLNMSYLKVSIGETPYHPNKLGGPELFVSKISIERVINNNLLFIQLSGNYFYHTVHAMKVLISNNFF